MYHTNVLLQCPTQEHLSRLASASLSNLNYDWICQETRVICATKRAVCLDTNPCLMTVSHQIPLRIVWMYLNLIQSNSKISHKTFHSHTFNARCSTQVLQLLPGLLMALLLHSLPTTHQCGVQ